MSFDGWTLALQAINVLILLYLLSRFLFRPVVAIMAERQAAATRDLDAARAAREAAAAERAAAAAETAALAAGRQQQLAAVAAEAETRRQALLATARSEADALRAAAEAEIARARAAAIREDRAAASRLAVDIAARLMARLPAAAQVEPFIAGLGAGVAALPDAARASLAAEAGPLRLTAARPLVPAEETALQDALGAALGRPVALDVTVEPELIAGLELDAPHAVVRNSFRADLVRICAELTRPEGEGGAVAPSPAQQGDAP